MQSFARNFRKSLLFCSKSLLMLLLIAVFLLCWWFKYPEAVYYEAGNYLVVAFYSALLIAVCNLYGAVKIGVLRLGEVVYSFILSLVIVNGIGYIQFSFIARTLLLPFWMLAATALQIAMAILGAYWINKLYFRLYPAREVAVIYSRREQAQAVVGKLSLKKERYRVCVVVSEEESFEHICQVIDRYNSIMICEIDENLRRQLFSYCSLRQKRIYIIPSFQDVLIRSSHSTQLFDTPAFYCKNVGPATELLLFKRMVDVFLSLLALVVSSPFMLVIAICIKAYDGGPVLFVQDRLTRGGRIFRLFKFRSMREAAEGDGIARLSTKNDDRITPVGRVIRKLRLDELPQVINILRGDMSIVGPRPERPEIAEQIKRELPEFNLRLRMKAGLTGYAQVHGRYNTSLRDKLMLDLLYIENYSPFLDFKLIFMTVKILFMPESTEGVNDGTELPPST